MASDNSPVTATAVTQPVPPVSPEKVMMDNLLMLGLLFFIFYFMLIRPQQKRVKMHRDLVKALAKGNKVMTNGGIIGTIAKLEGEEVIVVEIAPNVQIRMARSAVSEVLNDKPASGKSANDN